MVAKKTTEAAMSAAEFKAKCLKVMDEVARGRQPVVVTKRGKPVVRIVPMADEGETELFGCLADRYEIVGDIEGQILPAWNVLR